MSIPVGGLNEAEFDRRPIVPRPEPDISVLRITNVYSEAGEESRRIQKGRRTKPKRTEEEEGVYNLACN